MSVSFNDGVTPDVDADGVPLCSEGACVHFDGKRCAATGFRPVRVCEPAVMQMAASLRVYQRACDAAVKP